MLVLTPILLMSCLEEGGLFSPTPTAECATGIQVSVPTRVGDEIERQELATGQTLVLWTEGVEDERGYHTFLDASVTGWVPAGVECKVLVEHDLESHTDGWADGVIRVAHAWEDDGECWGDFGNHTLGFRAAGPEELEGEHEVSVRLQCDSEEIAARTVEVNLELYEVW